MRIVITGSVATDHLLTFAGKFVDSFVSDALDKISVSFLADSLDVRRGGVAGNIAFGLGVMGLRPVLVAAAGEDFADYRQWLERHGVDCGQVRIFRDAHTARFMCTTDETLAQIATFYPGAMSHGREISLAEVWQQVGETDLVLIGAHDPQGMLLHTRECLETGIPFVADPSQQLSFADKPMIRELISGAAFFFSNEYEDHLAISKSGWSHEEILERVGVRVITRGAGGASIYQQGRPEIHVPVVSGLPVADPTGVGDAFRAGFFAALSWGADFRLSAQVGSILASYVVETVGTQEYAFTREEFLARALSAYGRVCADFLGEHLP